MSTIFTTDEVTTINRVADAAGVIRNDGPTVMATLVSKFARHTTSKDGGLTKFWKAMTDEAPALKDVLPLKNGSYLQAFKAAAIQADRHGFELPVTWFAIVRNNDDTRLAGLKQAYEVLKAEKFTALMAEAASVEDFESVIRKAKATQEPAKADEPAKTAASKAAKVTAQVAAVTKSLGKLESVTKTESDALIAAAKALLKAAESVKVENLAIEAAPAA